MQFEVRTLAHDRISTVVVDALSETDAFRQITAQAMRPLSARPRRRTDWLGRRKLTFSLLLFSQELLTLLEAGLSIVEALEALAEKERRPETRQILGRIQEQLRQGKPLSVALGSIADIFPPLYVGIIRAAERTSNLPESLGRYVDYQARFDALRSKLISASIYPAILLTVGTLVALFLLGYVVPRFATVYQGTGRELPWLSAQLMHWGAFIGQHGIAALAGILTTIATLGVVVAKTLHQGGLARLLQRLPGLAETVRVFQLARFYLTLGMLLDGGLPILQGLALVQDLLSPDMARLAGQASTAIERGECVSIAFERSGLSTPVGLRMLRIGEQSGRMGEMMARAAKIHDHEITQAIEWFSKVFEPVLMVAIGLVIGLIVVLLYMPIFDLAGSLQ